MRTQSPQFIKRNSLIGSTEGQTGNCCSGSRKTLQNGCEFAPAGRVRRLVGAFGLVIAGFLAVQNHNAAPAIGTSINGLSSQHTVQKADLIDDIIDIINKIINPPSTQP